MHDYGLNPLSITGRSETRKLSLSILHVLELEITVLSEALVNIIDLHE